MAEDSDIVTILQLLTFIPLVSAYIWLFRG